MLRRDLSQLLLHRRTPPTSFGIIPRHLARHQIKFATARLESISHRGGLETWHQYRFGLNPLVTIRKEGNLPNDTTMSRSSSAPCTNHPCTWRGIRTRVRPSGCPHTYSRTHIEQSPSHRKAFQSRKWWVGYPETLEEAGCPVVSSCPPSTDQFSSLSPPPQAMVQRKKHRDQTPSTFL